MLQHPNSQVSYLDTCSQWRSYTRAYMGLGPGEFLTALVNHQMFTYLNPVA